MTRAGAALTAVVLLSSTAPAQVAGGTRSGSIYLERVSWVEAERALTPDAVVVIAVGAASKAHGPHLPLSTDFIQAEYVKERVAERTRVVVAPSIGYGYYPPFAEPIPKLFEEDRRQRGGRNLPGPRVGERIPR